MSEIKPPENSDPKGAAGDDLEEMNVISDDATEGQEGSSLGNLLVTVPISVAGGMAKGSARLVAATAATTLRFGRAMLRPERLEMMRETGLYLRDIRKVAGLTLMALHYSVAEEGITDRILSDEEFEKVLRVINEYQIDKTSGDITIRCCWGLAGIQQAVH